MNCLLKKHKVKQSYLIQLLTAFPNSKYKQTQGIVCYGSLDSKTATVSMFPMYYATSHHFYDCTTYP